MVMTSLMPDFLGIGAARSGTSWVWTNLRRHPEIWTPRTKEKHFFDRRFDNRVTPLLPKRLERKLAYAVHFLEGTLRGKTTGEFTPAYAVLPRDRVRIIREWIPDAKLIMILRDPVERTWSHAKKDFESTFGVPLAEATFSQLERFFTRPGVENRSDYVNCLKNWFAFFPRSQFHVTFNRIMRTDPKKLLRDLYDFLGVDPDITFSDHEVSEKVHESESVEMPKKTRSYLEEKYAGQKDELQQLLEKEIPW